MAGYPPPPSYGAYDQPPPPGFGYPPNPQTPYYPQQPMQPPYNPVQPGIAPTICQPTGGYYPGHPGQPATQTIVIQDRDRAEEDCAKDCCLCALCTAVCCFWLND